MGRETGIQWTHHTFNPWWGCEKVSPGCANCYAESLAKRFGQKVWGPRAPRRPMSEKYWIEPHKWDVEAKHAGERRRVFCASMADVFERRPDLQQIREKLWTLIESTSGLDWLLLTKRPENILDMIPDSWKRSPRLNVWYGTSVEDQAAAEARIPMLQMVPAAVRFLSIEPLLGPINISGHLRTATVMVEDKPFVDDKGIGYPAKVVEAAPLIHWAIIGGESGPRARESRVGWIRSLVAQCVRAKVSVFVKQLGAHVIDRNDAGFEGDEPTAWPMDTHHDDWDEDPGRQYQGADTRILLGDSKGGDPEEWPGDLRIRELPPAAAGGGGV